MDAAQDWLFAPPAWVPVALAVLGIAALLFGLVRGNARGRYAGIAVALLGVAWFGIAAAVETFPEQAASRTTAIVESYDEADWAAMRGLLDDETRLILFNGSEIADRAQELHGELGHESLQLKNLDAQRDPVGVRVKFNVTSNQTNGQVPRFTTAWQFDYRVAGDELRLGSITPLTTQFIDADTVRARIGN